MAAANKGGSIEWATGSRLEGRDKHLLFEYRLSALLCFVRSDSHLNVITELWNLPAVPRRSSAKAQQVSIPLAFYLYPEFRRGHGQRQFRAEVIRPEDYRESAR